MYVPLCMSVCLFVTVCTCVAHVILGECRALWGERERVHVHIA